MAQDAAPDSGPRLRLFDVSEFGRMLEGDFFDEDCRVDLVSGALTRAEPYSPRRIDAMERIGKQIERQCDDSLLVRVKKPVRLDWRTEMRPDIAVVRNYPKVPRLYSVAPPAARDIVHLIELIDGPEGANHSWKAQVYAHHGIGSLWIVDLHQQHIVDHAVAEPDGYAVVRTYSRGQSIPGLLTTDPRVSVDEILG